MNIVYIGGVAVGLSTIIDLDEQERNEENTKLKYITPAIQKKWNSEGDRMVMEYGKDKFGNDKSGHYFTDGQILVDGEGGSFCFLWTSDGITAELRLPRQTTAL